VSEFLLKQSEKLVGTLRLYQIDQPYFYCKFEPTEAFQPFKSFFDQELKLLNEGNFEVWDEFYHQITNFNLMLVVGEGGEIIKDFLLHIENDEAWFRY